MSRIRNKDTKPEIIVRSILHGEGLRFTVNGPKNKKLPGKPDIVLPKYKTVIFVHGCFWHNHEGCKLAYIPKSNTDFWTEKFEKNRARDQRNLEQLQKMNWKIGIIWECALRLGHTEKVDFKNLIANSDFWEIGVD